MAYSEVLPSGLFSAGVFLVSYATFYQETLDLIVFLSISFKLLGESLRLPLGGRCDGSVDAIHLHELELIWCGYY